MYTLHKGQKGLLIGNSMFIPFIQTQESDAGGGAVSDSQGLPIVSDSRSQSTYISDSITPVPHLWDDEVWGTSALTVVDGSQVQDAGQPGNMDLLVGNNVYKAVGSTIEKRTNPLFKSISTEASEDAHNIAVMQDGHLCTTKADDAFVVLDIEGSYIYATGSLYSPNEGDSVPGSSKYVIACTSTGVYRIGTYTYSNGSYIQSLTPVALKTGITVLQLTGNIHTEASEAWHALLLYLEQGTTGPGKLARVAYNGVVDLGFSNAPNWSHVIGQWNTINAPTYNAVIGTAAGTYLNAVQITSDSTGVTWVHKDSVSGITGYGHWSHFYRPTLNTDFYKWDFGALAIPVAVSGKIRCLQPQYDGSTPGYTQNMFYLSGAKPCSDSQIIYVTGLNKADADYDNRTRYVAQSLALSASGSLYRLQYSDFNLTEQAVRIQTPSRVVRVSGVPRMFNNKAYYGVALLQSGNALLVSTQHAPMYYLKTATGEFEAYGTYTKILQEGHIRLLLALTNSNTYVLQLYQTQPFATGTARVWKGYAYSGSTPDQTSEWTMSCPGIRWQLKQGNTVICEETTAAASTPSTAKTDWVQFSDLATPGNWNMTIGTYWMQLPSSTAQ